VIEDQDESAEEIVAYERNCYTCEGYVNAKLYAERKRKTSLLFQMKFPVDDNLKHKLVIFHEYCTNSTTTYGHTFWGSEDN
jgi:hypothetical protein